MTSPMVMGVPSAAALVQAMARRSQCGETEGQGVCGVWGVLVSEMVSMQMPWRRRMSSSSSSGEGEWKSRSPREAKWRWPHWSGF